MQVLRDGSTTVGAAFAPGHVTGVFAPRVEARDPRARGSVGAGLVLELGVHAVARWAPRGSDRVVVHSTPHTPTPISLEAATRTKAGRKGRLTVELTHGLPVGQGFGMSAAGALATANACATAMGLPTKRALQVAHLADLFGGGGLGGVSAIAGGGLEVRQRPGIPPWGSVRRLRFQYPVFVATVGRPLPSPPLLRDAKFLARVESAADSAFDRLGARPTAQTFLSASEAFTDRLRLASPALRTRIGRLRRSRAAVCQAMFGRTIFAVPRDSEERARLILALREERLTAVELAVLPPKSERL